MILAAWIESIRTRKRTSAGEEEGCYPAVACFVGSQAFRGQSRVAWDARWNPPA